MQNQLTSSSIPVDAPLSGDARQRDEAKLDLFFLTLESRYADDDFFKKTDALYRESFNSVPSIKTKWPEDRSQFVFTSDVSGADPVVYVAARSISAQVLDPLGLYVVQLWPTRFGMAITEMDIAISQAKGTQDTCDVTRRGIGVGLGYLGNMAAGKICERNFGVSPSVCLAQTYNIAPNKHPLVYWTDLGFEPSHSYVGLAKGIRPFNGAEEKYDFIRLNEADPKEVIELLTNPNNVHAHDKRPWDENNAALFCRHMTKERNSNVLLGKDKKTGKLASLITWVPTVRRSGVTITSLDAVIAETSAKDQPDLTSLMLYNVRSAVQWAPYPAPITRDMRQDTLYVEVSEKRYPFFERSINLQGDPDYVNLSAKYPTLTENFRERFSRKGRANIVQLPF